MTILVSDSAFRSYLGTGTPDSTTYFRGDGTWQSAITATTLTSSGNLAFTGTGNRITGDFSNATPANRVVFQSSVVNGATSIFVMPNGTSTNSEFRLAGGTDLANTNFLVASNTGATVTFRSGITGTGTYLPMTFFNNGVEKLRLAVDGNFIVGTAAIATTATAGFPWIPSCAGTPTGAPTAPYSNAAAMVVDTTNSKLYVLVGSTWKSTTLA